MGMGSGFLMKREIQSIGVGTATRSLGQEEKRKALFQDEHLFELADELMKMERQLPLGYTYAGGVPTWWDDDGMRNLPAEVTKNATFRLFHADDKGLTRFVAGTLRTLCRIPQGHFTKTPTLLLTRFPIRTITRTIGYSMKLETAHVHALPTLRCSIAPAALRLDGNRGWKAHTAYCS